MKSSIFIPKTINVGYQNRSGTYTGKLAYVIYYDEKGKLRKETSWENWRDQKIPNEEFENVPTSGFVLNKKVGDYDSGWNHRHAYCRIYDPRNFEFEITFENLLYILENANSIKGKGLEGEFVYGWDGKDLVLMPVESPDYKQISEYNKIIHNNETIKAKDLIVGATYLTKDNEERIYMGKFDYYSYGYRWLEGGEYKTSKKYEDIPREPNRFGYSKIDYDDIDYLYGKYFWFAQKIYDYEYVNGERVNKSTYKWEFDVVKSMSGKKYISCVDEQCSSEYADIYEAMIRTCIFSPRDYSKNKYIPYTFEEFQEYANQGRTYNGGRFFRSNKTFYSEKGDKYNIYYKDDISSWTVEPCYNQKKDDFYDRFDFEEVETGFNWNKRYEKKIVPMTIEVLYEKLKPCYKEIYLENGLLYTKENYYGN